MEPQLFLYDNQQNVQMRELTGGTSFASSNSLIAHFGLGQSNGIDSVVLHWPSGIIQTLNDLNINSIHDIIEQEVVSSSNEEEYAELITIYPNPADKWIEIKWNCQNCSASSIPYKYEIKSMDGRIVKLMKNIRGNQKIEHF